MPGCARFISEDPIGWASGQTNNYSYVGGNPVSKTDPTGLIDPSMEGHDNWVPAGEYQRPSPLAGTLTPSKQQKCIATCMAKKSLTGAGITAGAVGLAELGARTGALSPLATVGVVVVARRYGPYYSGGKFLYNADQCRAECETCEASP
jgi:hypothetical protein